ncbi:MAG: CoA-binding protein [Acidobacteria bacterium]|nr:CoA-binding protein [Acidobacteriota bacterium]
MDWKSNIIENEAAVHELLRGVKTIAVLGIKTEAQFQQPAFYVPKYMQDKGYRIIPVPVYYPEATEILGEKVYRRLADIPEKIDLVNVFRRPADIPAHVADILAARPAAVWFQLGIRHDEAARTLAEHGIKVVQDLCLMVEHRYI